MRLFTKQEAMAASRVLETEGKKPLFYHRDGDGACSAALFLTSYTGLDPVPLEGPILGKGFARAVLMGQPAAAVFLDVAVDQEKSEVFSISRQVPVLVLDHHIPEADMNRQPGRGSKGVVHLNPLLGRESHVYLPTSYLSYCLLEKLGMEPKDMGWVAAIGVISDYGYKDCAAFLDRMGNRYGRDALHEGARILDSAITLKGMYGAERALDEMIRSPDLQSFVENRRLRRWRSSVEREMKKALDRAEASKDDQGPVLFFTVDSHLNITSDISTVLSERYSDRTVVLRKENPDGWKISIRNQSGSVNVGELSKKAVRGIGSGGGHPKAAGAMVSDWELFRDRVLKELATR